MTTVRMLANKYRLRTKDATENIDILLKSEDIKMAKKRDPQHCAFACAVVRQLPDVSDAFFFKTTAWLRKTDDTLVRYDLPPSLRSEINAFDRGGKMSPGKFFLRVPSKGNTLKAIKKRNKTKSRKREPGPRLPRQMVAFSGDRRAKIKEWG